MVFPGVRIHAANRAANAPPPPDTPTSLDETQDAASIIAYQCREWRTFTLDIGEGRDRARYTYYFQTSVRATRNPVPVRNWVIDPTSEDSNLREDTRDLHARSYVSALAEARTYGLNNIAVIHPTFSRNQSAPRLRWDGTFESTGSAEMPLLERPSNMMSLRYDELRGPHNQTAAHEFGHLLGLGHQRSHPGTLMYTSQNIGLPRSLLIMDRIAVHESAETYGPGSGVVWLSTRPRQDYNRSRVMRGRVREVR